MKAVSLYKLTNTQQTLASITEEAISQFSFKPCGSTDTHRIGFSETEIDSLFVTQLPNKIVLSVTEQYKKPKKYSVQTLVEQQKIIFEADSGVPANKKLIKQWTLEATESLLPTTEPDEPKTYTVVIRNDGLVMVEASYKKAEDILSLLRKTIGSLPVVPVETEIPVGDFLDSLVTAKSSDKITLGNKGVFLTSEGLSHTLSKGSLYDSSAKELVEDEGAMTSLLSVNYDGVVDFTIKDDLSLSGIKFDKEVFIEVEKDDVASTTILKLNEIDKIVDDILGRVKVK